MVYVIEEKSDVENKVLFDMKIVLEKHENKFDKKERVENSFLFLKIDKKKSVFIKYIVL